MLTVTSLSIDGQKLTASRRSHYCGSPAPLFTWSAESSMENDRQSYCKLTAARENGELLWDSGWVAGEKQSLRYGGPEPMEGERLEIFLKIKNLRGEESPEYREYFYSVSAAWKAPWISSAEERPFGEARYFCRDFTIDSGLRHATLYACGIGYQKVFLNGREIEDCSLDPAFTNYRKQCQYVFYPELEKMLQRKNRLCIAVGSGWRDNARAEELRERMGSEFYGGEPLLSAMLKLEYENGETDWVYTDSSWQCAAGPIVYNDIYNGITFDARIADPAQTEFGSCIGSAAVIRCGPGGKLTPMLIPPISFCESRCPLTQWTIDGKYFLDFGQNMAGVLSWRIPAGLPSGTAIRITHSEELDENGRLYTLPLGTARNTDTYIASGKEDGTSRFTPCFTYHGFRYACIEGIDRIAPGDIQAVALRNKLDKKSFFSCGNPIVSKIHDICLATERANIHGMLTDCPQRAEREGWLNDTTVRFEAFPYCFESARIYRKIVQDILDEQKADGSISCTAPFAGGYTPADPVCSSFLILGREAVSHYDDIELISLGYDGFKKWTDFLLAHSDNGIVNYSYYADWSSPVYACLHEMEGDGHSAVTPGLLMSTGYSYFNCRTMVKFATLLGKTEDADFYRKKADFVRQAIIRKWYDPSSKIFATGSMSCQTFMLWLGIFPEGDDQTAAANLRDELVESDFHFTTGNLCTRYLFEVLTSYGYVDTAWQLITRLKYPSFGFMIQQEATTVWERMELFRNGITASHNHPMFAAVYRWFYAYLAGIRMISGSMVRIEPFFPDELLSLHAGVETVKGMVTVRWVRRFNKRILMVTIPFGMTAEVFFNGSSAICGSGFHRFETSEKQDFTVSL